MKRPAKGSQENLQEGEFIVWEFGGERRYIARTGEGIEADSNSGMYWMSFIKSTAPKLIMVSLLFVVALIVSRASAAAQRERFEQNQIAYKVTATVQDLVSSSVERVEYEQDETPTPNPTQEIVIQVQYPTQDLPDLTGDRYTSQGSALGCVGCIPYVVSVRLTYYWPNTPPTEDEINAAAGSDLVRTNTCWAYSLSGSWCVSHMASDIAWESFIGRAAACPAEWPFGTLVEVPALGMTFTCLDRGAMVCSGEPVVCEVDLLLENRPAWDSNVYESYIKVPPGW